MAEGSQLSGLDKAAVLLLTLGEEEAASVLRFMPRRTCSAWVRPWRTSAACRASR